MTLSALILVASLTAPVQAPEPHQDGPVFKALIVAFGAVAGGDIASTAAASQMGNVYEVNPLYKPLFARPVLLGMVNGATSAGVALWIKKWHVSDKAWQRRAARIILPVYVVLRAVVVYRNVQTLRKARS